MTAGVHIMNWSFWLSIVSAILAVVAALFWLQSARVQVRVDFLHTDDLGASLNKISRISFWAALFAGFSGFLVGAATIASILEKSS